MVVHEYAVLAGGDGLKKILLCVLMRDIWLLNDLRSSHVVVVVVDVDVFDGQHCCCLKI